MSLLELLLQSPVWTQLGLVLMHFLWQGALIVLLAAAFFHALRGRRAEERYAIGCLALLAMAICPVATWWQVSLPASVAPLPGNLALEGVARSASGGVLALLSWLWIAGVCAGQARLLVWYLRANQLRRQEAELAGSDYQALMRDLGQRLGLRRVVQLYRSNLARVPALVGWLKPVVLVPVGVLTQLSRAELEAVLAHELAHLKRCDPWINALQSILESLLFFHPAVWWLSAKVREEREFCCDDLAVQVCGDTLCYARALTSLDSIRCEESALVLSSTGGSLMHRIQRLIAHKGQPAGRASFVAPLLFTGLTAGFAATSAFGGSWTEAEQENIAAQKVSAVVAQDEAGDIDWINRRIQELEERIARLKAELNAHEKPAPEVTSRGNVIYLKGGDVAASLQAGEQIVLETTDGRGNYRLLERDGNVIVSGSEGIATQSNEVTVIETTPDSGGYTVLDSVNGYSYSIGTTDSSPETIYVRPEGLPSGGVYEVSSGNVLVETMVAPEIYVFGSGGSANAPRYRAIAPTPNGTYSFSSPSRGAQVEGRSLYLETKPQVITVRPDGAVIGSGGSSDSSVIYEYKSGSGLSTKVAPKVYVLDKVEGRVLDEVKGKGKSKVKVYDTLKESKNNVRIYGTPKKSKTKKKGAATVVSFGQPVGASSMR